MSTYTVKWPSVWIKKIKGRYWTLNIKRPVIKKAKRRIKVAHWVAIRDWAVELYTDWGSRWNPWVAWCWWVIKSKWNILKRWNYLLEEDTTNNVAEYIWLICGLWDCIDSWYEKVDVFMDSLLVINQVLLEWSCKDDKMQELLKEVRVVSRQLDCEFNHIRREYNREADNEANIAMDRRKKSIKRLAKKVNAKNKRKILAEMSPKLRARMGKGLKFKYKYEI